MARRRGGTALSISGIDSNPFEDDVLFDKTPGKSKSLTICFKMSRDFWTSACRCSPSIHKMLVVQASSCKRQLKPKRTTDHRSHLHWPRDLLLHDVTRVRGGKDPGEVARIGSWTDSRAVSRSPWQQGQVELRGGTDEGSAAAPRRVGGHPRWRLSGIGWLETPRRANIGWGTAISTSKSR